MLLTKYFSGDKVKKDEVGGACGVFGGKGTLIFNSGDRLEGALHGAWNEGVKITGTLHKNTTTPSSQLKRKPR